MALLCLTTSCGDSGPETPGASRKDGPAGYPTDASSSPEAPPFEGSFEVIRWEDAYAAGDLELAWAIASDHGDVEKIGILLGDGFDPDTATGSEVYKQPALVEAAWSGYEDVVDRLLVAGADPMARELYFGDIGFYEPGKGDTALHKAAFKGYVSIVEKLLGAGVPVDVEGIQGRTPLANAGSDLETFQVLIEAGANLEKAGGIDLLFLNAVSGGSVDMASYLLSRGASIEGEAGRRGLGYTPLWSAVTSGRHEMVLFLLERGANPRVRPSGKTLAELARGAGRQQVAELLERALGGKPLRPAVEASP